MIYNEIATSGLVTSGCVFASQRKYIQTTYGPGDIAYNKKKAQFGKLEKIGIKDFKIRNKGGLIVILYVDIANFYWNEWDLVTHKKALDLAIAYQEEQLKEAQKLDTC